MRNFILELQGLLKQLEDRYKHFKMIKGAEHPQFEMTKGMRSIEIDAQLALLTAMIASINKKIDYSTSELISKPFKLL